MLSLSFPLFAAAANTTSIFYGARTLVHPEKRMVQRRFSPWYTMATALGPVFVATAAPSRKVAAGA